MTNASGTVTREYVAQNRVIRKTVSGVGTSTYLCDVTTGIPVYHTGEVTTDAKGNVATRVYDRAGRLYQISSGSDVTTYTYMDNGSLELLTYPNGLMAQYTYYDNNKLHTLANKSGNTILSAYNYTYDAAGNLVAELDIDGTTTYTYDELNRLESVTEPDGKLTEYTYDAAGNREAETVTDGSDVTTTSYTYDEDLNRLAGTEKTLPGGALETTLYDYDGNGALVSKHTETLSDAEAGDVPALSLSLTGGGGDGYALYAYDVWGQLTSAETPDSVSAYDYNGEGLRVSKSVTEDVETTETAYLYEYSKVVLELDENGDEAAHNVYGNKTLISRTTGDGTLYYLYNGHGDVVQLADALGAIVMTYDYDAFGVVTTATGSISNSYLYSGYLYDGETGMYYLNARYYDPVVARFVSADSYLGEVNDPLSLNVYTYCRNNPLIYWDPTGHADVAIRLSNESQGNTVDWKPGSGPQSSTITITTTSGTTTTLKEGQDFYISSDGTAYYKNQSDNTVRTKDNDKNLSFDGSGGTNNSKITINGSTLQEGVDYYIGNDGTAYYYGNNIPAPQYGTLERKYSNQFAPVSLVPTVLEAAYMSEHIYDYYKYDMGPEGTVLRTIESGNWVLLRYEQGWHGMIMGIYARVDVNHDEKHPLAYALVFKGSSNVSDYATNARSMDKGENAKQSIDMQDAISYSGKFIDLHPNASIAIVGHSKGGGEAIVAAATHKKDAITFNAANFNFKLYELSDDYNDSTITNYYVEDEWLSDRFGVSSIGEKSMIPNQYYMDPNAYTGRNTDNATWQEFQICSKITLSLQ